MSRKNEIIRFLLELSDSGNEFKVSNGSSINPEIISKSLMISLINDKMHS